jgi:hypothetical protein
VPGTIRFIDLQASFENAARITAFPQPVNGRAGLRVAAAQRVIYHARYRRRTSGSPMCIFSQPVERVCSTRIFARHAGERQVLVYEMRLVSQTDQAMILPLPTRGTDAEAVGFIDLSARPQFFEDLHRCFPVAASAGCRSSDDNSRALVLAVHRVGAFEASFVPTRADFVRLDPRFRLDDALWDQFPAYEGFGFAVFQLRAGDARVHPMALSFRTRDTERLFYPTAHVHDGMVHPTAEYDHLLYAQRSPQPQGWRDSGIVLRDALDAEFFAAPSVLDLVDPDGSVAGRGLSGELPNQDMWVDGSWTGALASVRND